MSSRGFWIHVDADVLDPSVLPAVDSPTPGGLDAAQLTDLLRELAGLPGAVGAGGDDPGSRPGRGRQPGRPAGRHPRVGTDLTALHGAGSVVGNVAEDVLPSPGAE
ncbi:arginase family protein [Nonomuraea sp. M3C6]|uniref:Arginase family protein n=1 Tax=Nonomuraea marmarensis TaxID=3351344 RepID=A0ABW7A984_9ACTN